MAIDIGRINYEEYRQSMLELGKNDIPPWEDIGQEQCNAWRNAACKVLQYLEEARQYDKQHPETIE